MIYFLGMQTDGKFLGILKGWEFSEILGSFNFWLIFYILWYCLYENQLNWFILN